MYLLLHKHLFWVQKKYPNWCLFRGLSFANRLAGGVAELFFYCLFNYITLINDLSIKTMFRC